MTQRFCDECGRAIPQKRLAAMPDVRLCIECASPRDTLLRASDRLVMNSLVQRAEYDLEHHRPEAHV